MKTAYLQWITLPVSISCYCFVCTQANSGSVYSGRNFCPNPVNPVPAGFQNSKSGAPLQTTNIAPIESRLRICPLYNFFHNNIFYIFYLQSKAYTRGITKPQFERMLHVLSLNLQANELVVSVVHAYILDHYMSCQK